MKKEKSEKEQAILKAAEAEFIAKGFAGARTTSIAAAAGVTHAMLHYYFKTKEALFNRIIEEKFTILATSVMEPLMKMRGKDIFETIRMVVSNHFDLMLQSPELPIFVLREISAIPEILKAFRDKAKPFAAMIMGAFQEDLDRAHTEGIICKISIADLLVDIISLNIWAISMGPMVTEIFGMSREEYFAARKEESIETILKRLKP